MHGGGGGGGNKQTRNSLKILDREQKKKKKPTDKKYTYTYVLREKREKIKINDALHRWYVLLLEIKLTNPLATDRQCARHALYVLAERDRCTRKNKVNGITRRRVI